MTQSTPHTASQQAAQEQAARQQAAQQHALMRLGVLLQLQRRVRQADNAELPFIFVNETHVLAPYRQAVFWHITPDGDWRVSAVSGLSVPDRGAPFILWLERIIKHQVRKKDNNAPRTIQSTDLPKRLALSWDEWLPPLGWWMPMWNRGRLVGVLALFRDEAFRQDERELLGHAVEAFAQSLTPPVSTRRHMPPLRRLTRTWRFWVPVVACVILLLPIRQTVLAPAEVIPLRPAHIRAPLDGVVERIEVSPNQAVLEGDILLRLDDRQLTTRLVVAQKDLEIARTELQQSQQISLVDPRAKIRLPLQQGRVDQLAAEVDLVQSQLERVIIRSPAPGLALIDDPDAWAGRPINIGQKILEVAEPYAVQLEIALPMEDTLPLAAGDTLLFFPNIRPHSPQTATITFVSYQATETPEAGIAFILRAEFGPAKAEAPTPEPYDNATGENAPPRLGLRGTAKLYGERMPLALLLLRRPILQVRQWLGL